MNSKYIIANIAAFAISFVKWEQVFDGIDKVTSWAMRMSVMALTIVWTWKKIRSDINGKSKKP